jgi:hypothetical protein
MRQKLNILSSITIVVNSTSKGSTNKISLDNFSSGSSRNLGPNKI